MINSYFCSNLSYYKRLLQNQIVEHTNHNPIYSGCINAKTIKLVFVPCLHVNHARLRSMNKDWLAQNPDNVSGWRDISTRGLLFKKKCCLP